VDDSSVNVVYVEAEKFLKHPERYSSEGVYVEKAVES